MKDIYAKNKKAQKIVIKMGTRLLTHANGKINFEYLQRMVRVLANLKNQEKDVIIVSSGAIGAGIGRLNLNYRPTITTEKQAVAAVGQGLLIQFYEKFFSECGQIVAQILLTRSDLVSRRRYINARNTIFTLLKFGVIPIINENDTIAIEEIEFGDNDTLSALVAGLIDADLLVILSNIDGLYTTNPCLDAEGSLIPVVERITPGIKSLAKGTNEQLATGGMITKLQAAEIAVNCGINVIIANGLQPDNLNKIVNGEPVGTLFVAQKNHLRGRKRWIAYGQLVHGKVFVDRGAREAILAEGKSLLATGITSLSGHFEEGDLIAVYDDQNDELARGLVNYSSQELEKIKGLKSSQITEVLGYKKEKEEVIHRDNLVIC